MEAFCDGHLVYAIALELKGKLDAEKMGITEDRNGNEKMVRFRRLSVMGESRKPWLSGTSGWDRRLAMVCSIAHCGRSRTTHLSIALFIFADQAARLGQYDFERRRLLRPVIPSANPNPGR